MNSRIPYIVAEFDLEHVSDAVISTLSEILTEHGDYSDLAITWYPPESGQHSETWVTLAFTDKDPAQYCIGSRGGKKKIK